MDHKAWAKDDSGTEESQTKGAFAAAKVKGIDSMGLYINGQHLCKLVHKHQDNVNFTGQPQGALSQVRVTITPSRLKFIV